MNAQDYFNARNNASTDTMREIAKNPDGTARNFPAELAGAVLIAQSNLSIAAGLAWIAQAIEGRTS